MDEASGAHWGIPEVIGCVDCGGTCHRLSYLSPDEPPEEGDVIAYRCADCHDRWDIVLTADDLDATDG